MNKSASYCEKLESAKAMLMLCESKGWNDAVRILDQSEVLGTPWGEACTMQLIEYTTGEWVVYAPTKKATNTLTALYKLIRGDLAWSGPVRLAIASN